MNTELQDAIKALHTELRVSANGYGAVTVDEHSLRTVLNALSSPPADDVREALAEHAWSLYQVEHGYSTWGTVPDVGADFMAGFERGFEVRPYGTVTPTPEEVDAAAQSLASLSDEEWAAARDQEHVRYYIVSARLALEAAYATREARS